MFHLQTEFIASICHCSLQLVLLHSFSTERRDKFFHIPLLLASLPFLLDMADMDTAIPVPTERTPRRFTRQDTFFDVTMSKKRVDRIVPIMAVHETVSASQEVDGSIKERHRSNS